MHEQRYNQIAGRGVRRRRRDGRLMALRLTASGLALALVCELAWALYHSPRFQVRQVRIVGACRLSPAEVMLRAALPPRASLASVSLRRLRRDLEAIPAVAGAAATRDWPDTLVIVVRERTPAAFIRRATGIIFLDRQGIAFAGVNCDTAGLPELKGVNINLRRLGRAQRSKQLEAALAALVTAQETGFEVGQVVARAPDDLMLRLADGTALHLGRPHQLRLKLSQAKVALTQLEPRHQVEYIDVSCPDAAVWKPRALTSGAARLPPASS